MMQQANLGRSGTTSASAFIDVRSRTGERPIAAAAFPPSARGAGSRRARVARAFSAAAAGYDRGLAGDAADAEALGDLFESHYGGAQLRREWGVAAVGPSTCGRADVVAAGGGDRDRRGIGRSRGRWSTRVRGGDLQ